MLERFNIKIINIINHMALVNFLMVDLTNRCNDSARGIIATRTGGYTIKIPLNHQ